jgi:phage shock protein PspC (stress-responsive transcriptional regulator)
MADTGATSVEQLESLLREGRITSEDYARLRNAMLSKFSPDASPVDQPRRLRKSWTDRELGGVCGGIGEYIGVSATRVRLAFLVLLVFTGGTAMVAYLALYAFLPWNENELGLIPRFRWAYAAAILALTAALLALVQWVVPQALNVAQNADAVLPLGIRVLFAFSDWLGAGGFVIVPILVFGLVALGAALSRHEKTYLIFLRAVLAMLVAILAFVVLSFTFWLLSLA